MHSEKNKAVNIPFNFFLSNYICHLILNKKRATEPRYSETPSPKGVKSLRK